MSKSKKTETPSAAKVAGLTLLAIAPPGLTVAADVSKQLEKLGHKLVDAFLIQKDKDSEPFPVPETVSNICYILGKSDAVDGILLCPNWADDPFSRVEVFAAVNMELKLCALGLDGSLVEIDPWAVLMTLASHQQFKDAAAIYAPLPSRAG